MIYTRKSQKNKQFKIVKFRLEYRFYKSTAYLCNQSSLIQYITTKICEKYAWVYSWDWIFRHPQDIGIQEIEF